MRLLNMVTKRLVALLLEKGADANLKMSDNETPLHIASRLGFKAIVKLLIVKGAQVDAKDDHGHLYTKPFFSSIRK